MKADMKEGDSTTKTSQRKYTTCNGIRRTKGARKLGEVEKKQVGARGVPAFQKPKAFSSAGVDGINRTAITSGNKENDGRKSDKENRLIGLAAQKIQIKVPGEKVTTREQL